jgi:AP-4 complex subunit epsilon-1
MSGSHLSREFFDLVKAIGECRSKQEEDKIMESEVQILKSKFSDPQSKQTRELLVRSIYVEMLGHDASRFAYIHALNLSHCKSLTAKRVGYLATCLFLDPKNSELMILLINTIQKDLKSSNLLQVSFALIVISRLANADMVPVLVSQLLPLLAHASEMIRRRAVVAFHRLVQVGNSEDSLGPQIIHQVMRKSLCDSDPSVMAVGLNLLQDMVGTGDCGDLTSTVAGILRQVIEHKLPKDFEYHRMPAPWLQIRLVSILSGLNASLPEVESVLQETLRRADVGSNAGAAVAAECVKCIASMNAPSHTLLEHASFVVSKLMASENHNYRYMGVRCLSLLVTISPSYATEHQMRVVDCLEDSDDTLRRQTIELLTLMTNANNVTVVVEKLIAQLDDDDEKFKRDLADRICTLCERFAPSNEWYLVTLNELLSRVGDGIVNPSVTENLTRLVAEQDGPDDETGVDLRQVAANEYIRWLEQPDLCRFSNQFLGLIVWMLGEFAPLATVEGYATDDVLDLVIDFASQESTTVLPVAISAIGKLAVSGSEMSKSSAKTFFTKLLSDSKYSGEAHRRCQDLVSVLTQPEAVQRAVIPFDAACEDIDDVNLRFCDAFCAAARRNGARPYSKPTERSSASSNSPVAAISMKSLRFEAYEAPKPPSAPLVVAPPQPQQAPMNLPQSAKRWGPQVAVAKPTRAMAAPTSVQEVKPPQARAVPEVDTEFAEKQKIAEALFSGVGVGRYRPTAQRPTPQGRPTEFSSNAAVDLLDLGRGQSIQQSAKPTVTNNLNSSDDLLDL